MVHVVATNPPSGPRAARRAAKTAAILDAALDLVMEGGIEGFTLRRLAESLGYAVGAVYRYFPSKDAVLLALQQRVIGALAHRLEEAQANGLAAANGRGATAEAATLTQLVAAANAYARLHVEAPETFHLLGLLLGDPRTLLADEEAAEVVAASQPILTSLTKLFSEAQALGALSVGSPSDRATILFGASQGVLQLRKLSRVAPNQLNPDRLIAPCVDALLIGWGAETNTLSQIRQWLEAEQL